MEFTFLVFLDLLRVGEDWELDEDDEESLDDPEELSSLEEEDSLCRFGARFLADDEPPLSILI